MKNNIQSKPRICSRIQSPVWTSNKQKRKGTVQKQSKGHSQGATMLLVHAVIWLTMWSMGHVCLAKNICWNVVLG